MKNRNMIFPAIIMMFIAAILAISIITIIVSALRVVSVYTSGESAIVQVIDLD